MKNLIDMKDKDGDISRGNLNVEKTFLVEFNLI